jgi:uncharacterized protein YdcH (DUF465 family)
MEKRDLARIRELLPHEPELARLWEEHRELEEELERLKGLRTPTPADLLRQRELKKRKLVGRDRIQQILGRPG